MCSPMCSPMRCPQVWHLDETCGRCSASGLKWIEDANWTLSLDAGWNLDVVRRGATERRPDRKTLAMLSHSRMTYVYPWTEETRQQRVDTMVGSHHSAVVAPSLCRSAASRGSWCPPSTTTRCCVCWTMARSTATAWR